MNSSFIVGWGIICYLVSMLVLRSRKPHLPVWSIMAFSAFIVVLTGLVKLDEVSGIINVDVILFLIGMFSIVSLLDSSGVIDYLAVWFTTRFKTKHRVLYAIALTYGLLSAYTVNDALTFMGTPIALAISKAIGVELKILLLLIAFSITIGSVMTPVGNPQNMLVSSSSGIPSPFLVFAAKLIAPTLINLVLTTFILIKLYGVRNGRIDVLMIPSEKIKDRREAILGSSVFLATIALFILNDVFEAFGLPHVEKRGIIPFVTASICYMFAKSPRRVLEGVSWGTIVFFISMFITMNGVWRSGALTPILTAIHPSKSCGLSSITSIALSAILMSQFLSNVPFTSLYIEYMKNLGYTGLDINAWVTLAMASTIAGNLTLLGAASNIILLEVVEQRKRESITFIEFLKAGSIVTTVNLLIYIPFITLIPPH